MIIFSIPNKVDVAWNSEVKAIIDTWTSYQISVSEFKEAVLVNGLLHAKAHGGTAWIVDSSKAVGAFTRECQRFVDTDIFPSFSKHGIKYFITINSASPLTNITIKEYKSKAGPHGIHLIDMPNKEMAIEWLKINL